MSYDPYGASMSNNNSATNSLNGIRNNKTFSLKIDN